MTARNNVERKPYPRLKAPVYFTRAGFPWRFWQRAPSRDTLGGIRVFADEPPETGDSLQAEIFLLDGSSVTCRVVVAWVDQLATGAPARYEVGLAFTAIRPGDRERLRPLLSADSA
jgi:PilZ domain